MPDVPQHRTEGQLGDRSDLVNQTGAPFPDQSQVAIGVPVFPVVPAPILNKQGPDPTINALATGSVIPIVYGQKQVPGRIFAVHYEEVDGVWTVGVAWCMGECEAIVATYLSGAVAVTGVVEQGHLGTDSQTADSLLVAAIDKYGDTLVFDLPTDIGVCYTAYQFTDIHYPAFPQFVAEIKGMKTDAGAYSANPALALIDLIENDTYGLGETVIDAGTVEADNDATVSSEARREIGLALHRPLPTLEWIQILSAYASCWPVKVGTGWKLVSDRPRTSDATLTIADYVENSFSTSITRREQIPTVVKILYTDQTELIWREREIVVELAGVAAGTTPRRESTVRLPGVTRATQAKREATERLQKLQRYMNISFRAFDQQLVRQVGDVITVTHAMGHTAREFRVIASPKVPIPGRVDIQAIEYSSADYDDTETIQRFGDVSARIGQGTLNSLVRNGIVQNHMPFGYTNFEQIERGQILHSDPSGTPTGPFGFEFSTDQAFTGTRSLKLSGSATGGTPGGTTDHGDIFFMPGTGGSALPENIFVDLARRWMVVVAIYADNPEALKVPIRLALRTVLGGSSKHIISQDFKIPPSGEDQWTQFLVELDGSQHLAIDQRGAFYLRMEFLSPDPEGGNNFPDLGASPIWFVDALMLFDVTDYPDIVETVGKVNYAVPAGAITFTGEIPTVTEA